MADPVNPRPVKTPPVPLQPDTRPKKIVWVACRATKGCTGKQSEQVSHTPTQLGGHITRYKCTTCEKQFQIQL